MTITAPIRVTPAADLSEFDAAFERLSDARLEYETLRRRAAPTGALVEARASLHRARAEMALQRRAHTI